MTNCGECLKNKANEAKLREGAAEHDFVGKGVVSDLELDQAVESFSSHCSGPDFERVKYDGFLGYIGLSKTVQTSCHSLQLPDNIALLTYAENQKEPDIA